MDYQLETGDPPHVPAPNRVVKVRLHGGDADHILGQLARKYHVKVVTLTRRWWQRTPAKQVTIPYPGDDAYRLLQSSVVVQLGAFSNTSARIWTADHPFPADLA